MTSQAGNLSGAPYRGSNWTQHTGGQPTYRYTSPMPQTPYAAYTPMSNTSAVSEWNMLFLSRKLAGICWQLIRQLPQHKTHTCAYTCTQFEEQMKNKWIGNSEKIAVKSIYAESQFGQFKCSACDRKRRREKESKREKQMKIDDDSIFFFNVIFLLNFEALNGNDLQLAKLIYWKQLNEKI